MTQERSLRLKLQAMAALILLAGCAKEVSLASPKYPLDQCRRVALIDESGVSIRGAEDMGLDAAHDRLFVSAYDRRAAERAARRGAASIPQGGVYAVSLAALLDADDSLPVRAVVRSVIPGGLRPHGLSFDAAADELFVINRAYRRTGGHWRMTPRLLRIGAGGEALPGDNEKAPCAANDVLNDGGKLYFSFDHEYCDWRAALEDVFPARRSGVATEDGRTVYARAAFANGMTLLPDDDIALADTRARAILIMTADAGDLTLRIKIKTPGGPDNLTLAADGGVVAAVHPSLLKIALHRRLFVGGAPSRVIKANPQTGDVAVLFDDPTGALFSAATVAVEWKNALVIGSVTDEGILVCGGAS
ncbi:MAG: hypothetical protein AB7P23_08775 [Amphiplicatus sp.]